MTPEDSLQNLVAKLDQRYTIARARTQRTEAELAAKQLQLQALKDEVAEWTHVLAALKAESNALLRNLDAARDNPDD